MKIDAHPLFGGFAPGVFWLSRALGLASNRLSGFMSKSKYQYEMFDKFWRIFRDSWHRIDCGRWWVSAKTPGTQYHTPRQTMDRLIFVANGPKHGTTAWPQAWDHCVAPNMGPENTPSMGWGHCVFSEEFCI